MHEASLCVEVLRCLEEDATRRGFQRVRTVWLQIGRRRAVEPEAMRFAFELASRGTLADGARLELEEVPARGWCFTCDDEVALRDPTVECARCGSARTRVSGGDELKIARIEVE